MSGSTIEKRIKKGRKKKLIFNEQNQINLYFFYHHCNTILIADLVVDHSCYVMDVDSFWYPRRKFIILHMGIIIKNEAFYKYAVLGNS